MSVRCVAGQTYTFGIALESVANAGKFQVAPTLDALDFRISTNGGAFAALTNTPTVTPASGMRVQVVLAAAETTAAGAGGEIYLKCSDNSGGEWKDLVVAVPVYANAEDTLVTTATNVTTVNGLAAGVINAAAIATDAIDADAIKADAVTEIQSGLATATALATVATYIDTEVAAIKAKTDNLPSDPADASDIAALLSTITGYIDTEVAAIKAKTDLIPASPAATGDIPSAAAVTAAIMGEILEASKTFKQAILDIWATRVGDAARNSDDYPFTATYDSPDGTVQVSHLHTSDVSRTLQ